MCVWVGRAHVRVHMCFSLGCLRNRPRYKDLNTAVSLGGVPATFLEGLGKGCWKGRAANEKIK